jgi:hypothetical protein
MEKSEYDFRQCVVAAGKAFAKNIGVVLLTVSLLPLPGFVLWMDAPLALLCVELTLLDCFYLGAAVLLVYGMFGSVNEKIPVGTVLSPFLKPTEVLSRCWKFFYSESPGIWKSLGVMIIGIIFGLGAQWLAAPWKLPLEQTLIAACIYTACLVFWSEDLVGWMLAPYYLAEVDLPANEAYKRSQFIDKQHQHWDLRLVAVLSLLTPVLLFGIIRYLFLTPAEFVDYKLNLLLTYLFSIIPWILSVFWLFVWNQIYRCKNAGGFGNTSTLN